MGRLENILKDGGSQIDVMKKIVKNEEEMIRLGERIAEDIVLPGCVQLVGDVGAGKTTFTKGMARKLGVSEEITSPSFTISKRYETRGRSLVHYDFYRLDEIGIMAEELDETLSEENTLVVVEWANEAEEILPEDRMIIKIKYLEDGTREVEW